VIRVAAVGDIHVGEDVRGVWAARLATVATDADLLLLAGDLTRCGSLAEAETVARELEGVGVPTVAVLGNHDYHGAHVDEMVARLERAGVRVLECGTATFAIDGHRIGIAGTKGFGGGFPGACGSDFGEPEMKAFVRHTRSLAEGLERRLAALDTDVRVALLHYSPVPGTLEGERREIYPFLGSYFLAEAIDRAGADLALHGHAHAGSEIGATPGGVPVRNVAQPVIRRPYKVYRFGDDRLLGDG